MENPIFLLDNLRELVAKIFFTPIKKTGLSAGLIE
jgi:hypothetical protein